VKEDGWQKSLGVVNNGLYKVTEQLNSNQINECFFRKWFSVMMLLAQVIMIVRFRW